MIVVIVILMHGWLYVLSFVIFLAVAGWALGPQ